MSIPSLIPLGAAGVAGALASQSVAGSRSGESFLDLLRHAWRPGATSEHGTALPAETDALNNTTPPGDKKRIELAEDIQELSRRILQRLRAAGIDLSVPIELRSDGFGGVLVDEPHPQRADIERLLAADSELTDAFQSLADACASDPELRAETSVGIWSEFRLQLNHVGGRVVFE